jgi:putative PIG3 family NAD(P)H quinone oxidoreductase
MGREEPMRVVEIQAPGGPDVLRLAERASPPVVGDRVRVRTRTSGVNRADLLQRMGRYPAPPGEPQDVPGLEFAGIVEEVGPECLLRKVGDPLMGILGGGGYADAVVVPERATVRVPEGMDVGRAGAIPEVFMTAWDALVLQGGLGAGETVLVHAVGSGVGTAAVQLCRAWGARTIGTSRTADKVDRAVALGLDLGVVASEGADWPGEVRELAGERGVDLILDLVGAPYLDGNLDVLALGGRWIVVGVPGGSQGAIDLRKLMGKRGLLRGTVLRARPLEEKVRLAREFERTVVPLFERGVLAPVVDQLFPAAKAADAHRRMEANETFGKLLLDWGSAG